MTTSSKTNMNEDLKKDYIVVKSKEIAKDLVMGYKGKSLRGKWVIVAPDGLELVSLEDLLKLPQIETAITKAREEGLLEGRKLITKDMVEAMKIK